jgi:Protein of unknown function (DUF2971)
LSLDKVSGREVMRMTVFTPQKARGSHFYKYQSADHLDWLRPIILEDRIYVPLAAQLNDPNDCRPKLRSLSEDEMVSFLRTDYINRHPVIELDALEAHTARIRTDIQSRGIEWFNRELSEILNRLMEKFRVYSLTKRFDNLSLWAKYAADHTGYCLEFSNEGPLFAEHTMEVHYEDYAPFDVLNLETRDARFLVHKRPEWSNEEEVRLIRARDSDPPETRIDPRWLTRIILGKNMKEENRRQIREWAKLRQPELVVAQARFDGLRQELRLE